jgi:hypothetical protein
MLSLPIEVSITSTQRQRRLQDSILAANRNLSKINFSQRGCAGSNTDRYLASRYRRKRKPQLFRACHPE